MEIESAGYTLLGENKMLDSFCHSLWPLGIALVEGAQLFSILRPSTADRMLCGLFDGGESEGPNLYTLLRRIRDLFSASGYAVKSRSLGSAADSQGELVGSVTTPGEGYWTDLIRKCIDLSDGNSILEVSRLLDDSFEEMIVIAGKLRGFPAAVSSGSWNEIYRAICHIRDHFDYAEDVVLNCIRPGK